ncbi:MAG: hypothetical protein M3Z66_13455 [Chloroflexota bacterium]|nr:hypothetical protein [Chloroflexota bacterium]
MSEDGTSQGGVNATKPSEQAQPSTDALLHKATLGQFNAFCTAKGAVKPCPICGHQDWKANVSTFDSLVVVIAFFLLKLGQVFDQKANFLHWNAYTVYCGNCGFLRPHLAGIVDDWIAQSGK